MIVKTHYKAKYTNALTNIDQLRKEIQDSNTRYQVIQLERKDLEKRNLELVESLRTREDFVKVELIQLNKTVSDTDEKLDNPISSSVDTVGQWLRNKLGTGSEP